MNVMKLTLLVASMGLALTAACSNNPGGASPTGATAPKPQTIEQMEEQPQGDTVSIKSEKMGRSIKAVVVVPEQYFDPDLQEEQYPVVYLLHGADGSYRDWPNKADLDDLASEYGVIIACPDGQDSWYFDSPIDPKMQFETFVTQELVNYVDSHFRTLPERKYRAITGLSMGGHGALWCAWRHTNVFGACGSMSGGVDISQFPDKWNIHKRLGAYDTNKQRWIEHSVVSLVPTLKSGAQAIIIDDGSEDFFYKVNCELHEALMKHKIKHDFTIRPGNHSWTYWVNSLDYHMLFFSKYFAE